MVTDEKLAAMKAASKAEAAKDTEKAETWRPEPGDMLAGTLVRGDRIMTARGDSRIMVIHDEETDKDWTVWCSGKMLLDAVLVEQDPEEVERLEPRIEDEGRGRRPRLPLPLPGGRGPGRGHPQHLHRPRRHHDADESANCQHAAEHHPRPLVYFRE